MFFFNTTVRRTPHARYMAGVDRVATGLEDRYDHAAEVAILAGYLRRRTRREGAESCAMGRNEGGANGVAEGAASGAGMDECEASEGTRMSEEDMRVPDQATEAALSDDMLWMKEVTRMSIEITRMLAKTGLHDGKTFLTRIAAGKKAGRQGQGGSHGGEGGEPAGVDTGEEPRADEGERGAKRARSDGYAASATVEGGRGGGEAMAAPPSLPGSWSA